MSALLSTMRHNATRLDRAADLLPDHMRPDYRDAARRERDGRDLAGEVVLALAEAASTFESMASARNYDEYGQQLLAQAKRWRDLVNRCNGVNSP